MSACSSTVGSSLRSRKHSSVRNSPTPSTGAAAAGGLAVGDVGQQLHRVAVAVLPGPAQAARRRAARGPRRRAAASAASRPVSTVPAVPSTSSRVPGDLEGTGGADHARDAELAGDDRRVAGRATALGDQGQDDVGIQPGRVRGCEILGDENARRVGSGHAGFGFADEVGDDPAFDVAQVGGPLGHQAAHLVKIPTNWSTAACTEATKVVAGVELLADGAAQSLVAGQAGAGREHLGRGAGRLGGLAANPSATAPAASSYAARAASASANRRRRSARSRPGRPRRGQEGGRVGDPRDDGRARRRCGAEAHGGHVNSRASLTVNTFGRKTTYTQIKPHRRAPDIGRALYAEERQQAMAQLVRDAAVCRSTSSPSSTTSPPRPSAATCRPSSGWALVRRVHGGAVPADTLTVIESGLADRDVANIAQKQRIAHAAIDLLPRAGSTVLIDAGCTTSA